MKLFFDADDRLRALSTYRGTPGSELSASDPVSHGEGMTTPHAPVVNAVCCSSWMVMGGWFYEI